MDPHLASVNLNALFHTTLRFRAIAAKALSNKIWLSGYTATFEDRETAGSIANDEFSPTENNIKVIIAAYITIHLTADTVITAILDFFIGLFHTNDPFLHLTHKLTIYAIALMLLCFSTKEIYSDFKKHH